MSIRIRIAAVIAAGIGAVVPLAGTAAHAAAPTAGVATFAEQPGAGPNYIFPLVGLANAIVPDINQFQPLMIRPLYFEGITGQPQIDYAASLANPPVFSNGGRTVTIRLRRYRWSDGVPVTSRDVQFWMDELRAEATSWYYYIPGPGHFPQNVVAMTFPTPTTFTLTFNRAYNRAWLTNDELTQIYPVPQQAWDRTSGSSPIGNYDRSPAGARAVYAYLTSQAKQLASYATNPLWHVVDGPWQLAAFEPATGAATFVPNRRYSGPVRPHLARVEEVPFTSDQAEFDALRSGALTYGYLPAQDASQAAYFRSHGYRIAPWYGWSISYLVINFANPEVGPILRQLYIRQAMQHLIDQPAYVRDIYRGYAHPAYGPVPTVPSTVYSGPERRNAYPYSPAAAISLLRHHGWRVEPDGASVCQRPGAGAGACGAGIARGARLRLTLQYGAGVVATTQMMEALKSSFSRAGIDIALAQTPNNTVLANAIPCTHGSGPGCGWQLLFWNGGLTFFPDEYPTGGDEFASGAGFNPGSFGTPSADAAIAATHLEPGIAPFLRYVSVLTHQLPVLWMPLAVYQMSVISDRLQGALPQNPVLQLTPEYWRLRA